MGVQSLSSAGNSLAGTGTRELLESVGMISKEKLFASLNKSVRDEPSAYGSIIHLVQIRIRFTMIHHGTKSRWNNEIWADTNFVEVGIGGALVSDRAGLYGDPLDHQTLAFSQCNRSEQTKSGARDGGWCDFETRVGLLK